MCDFNTQWTVFKYCRQHKCEPWTSFIESNAIMPPSRGVSTVGNILKIILKMCFFSTQWTPIKQHIIFIDSNTIMAHPGEWAQWSSYFQNNTFKMCYFSTQWTPIKQHRKVNHVSFSFIAMLSCPIPRSEHSGQYLKYGTFKMCVFNMHWTLFK